MIFNAYERGDGALVLVPDCFVASRDAEARHGPLVHVGRIDARLLPEPRIWQRVLADMDAWGYTFRLGSAKAYFEHDAGDAWRWLATRGLVDPDTRTLR